VGAEENKQFVRRLVEEAAGHGNADILKGMADAEFAEVAKRWVNPLRAAFPDFELEIVDLIAEGPKVAGHFRCSGTHRGEWLGVPATSVLQRSATDAVAPPSPFNPYCRNVAPAATER
jgi:SnoaL-like polyketide cyclase